MFKRGDVPARIKAAGLSGWYSSLDDPSKVKLKRYLDGTGGTSGLSLLLSVMDNALEDGNHRFAVLIGEEAQRTDMDGYQRFMLRERMIEAYMGAEMYPEAKRACMDNLDLFPSVRDEAASGRFACRNRLIDILVGVESDYDTALGMLDRFFELGLISSEDLEFRRQSLRVHRLQRTFDGVYTYRPSK